MMKKFAAAIGIVMMACFAAMAQDWSEYSRGSDAWKRHNRDVMFRPWKYDRAGRLKRGTRVAVKKAVVRRRSRKH